MIYDDAGSAYEACIRKWDTLAKPIDGLGKYEKIIAGIGGIQRTDCPSVKKRTLIVFLADNGIVEEKVSQSGPEVTHKVAEAMSIGRSTVCVMAKEAGVRVLPVDVGMKGESVPGVEDRRIRDGSRNFLKEPAMTQDEAMRAIEAGYQVAASVKKSGDGLILLGEMGIGNTSTATALSCAMLSADPFESTGSGAGLPDEFIMHKREVIKEALGKYSYDPGNAFEVLSIFGGYDIAAMVGVIKAAAELNIPVVTDGLITLAAAFVAERMYPGAKDVCIASHDPREPMGKRLTRELGLQPVISADMALGEGTGAVLLVPQLDVCMALYNDGLRFEGLGIEAYERYKK
jgi:nicotinate-nucleotide--dimethylbenzimidazole phosphoribosyltransferase